MSGFQTRGSVVLISEQGWGVGHPVLGGTEVASPRLGAEGRNVLLHTEQGISHSWPDPTSHKESLSIVYVKVKYDPWN